MVQFISKVTFNALEEKFANRDEYKREIALKKAMIDDEWNAQNVDENVGGSRSGRISKPQEDLIIRYSVPYIKNRELWINAIYDTLDEFDTETRKLIEDKFWGEHSHLNWSEFSDVCYRNKSTLSRLRRKILKSFGDKIGEL